MKTFELTKSSRIKYIDFNSHWLQTKARQLALDPNRVHRKIWEHAAICQVFDERVREQVTLPLSIGFGVGTDPIASWLVNYGNSRVIATDLASDTWEDGNQNAKSLDNIYHSNVCPDRSFFNRMARFEPMDMNQLIWTDDKADFIWSSGSLEHIGGIEHSTEFLNHQSLMLKVGGWFAHTTEFNPEPHGKTLDTPGLCLFQSKHLKRIKESLEAVGCEVLPLALNPGCHEADKVIDTIKQTAPYHLNLQLGEYVTTSIVLIGRRTCSWP
jgi:hypothetical protein